MCLIWLFIHGIRHIYPWDWVITPFRNRPLVFEWAWGWSWPCFDSNLSIFFGNDTVPMLISRNLHKKSREVSIKARSPLASLSFKGQATRHTTVKINNGLFKFLTSSSHSRALFCEIWVFSQHPNANNNNHRHSRINFVPERQWCMLFCTD